MTRAKLAAKASLSGFWERQTARAAERKLRKEAYYADGLPVWRPERRALDCERDIYPAQRSPESYTRFRRIR